MKAFVLTGHGGFECLEWRSDYPQPEIEDDEVLIRVLACGLNNTDVNTRVGWYSKNAGTESQNGTDAGERDEDGTWGGLALKFPRIQGADVCGIVERVGAGVDLNLVSRRVLIDPWIRDWSDPLNRDKIGYFGSEFDGGFAEYTKVDHNQVHPVDSFLADAELATFATSWVTAENMLDRAQVRDGDRILITGASGGVGSALITLANLRGVETIAVCSDSKREMLQRYRPSAILSRSGGNLRSQLLEATGRNSVNVVADIVGGEAFSSLIEILEPRGRYVVSGAIAGAFTSLDLRLLYLKDLAFYGATITAPHTFTNLVSYINRQKIKPILAAAFPLEELHAAQSMFMEKKHVGNIVVTMTAGRA